MSVEQGGAAAAPVAIVAALADEVASLERGRRAAAFRVVQCGLGVGRAASAARTALADGARALVSWGLVGALDATLEAGDVVVPRCIRRGSATIEAASEWRDRCAALASDFRLVGGNLLTVDAPLDSRAAKTTAARSTGCIAVDMEAAGVAAVALEAHVPFVALRVVVDTLDDRLPPAEHWIDERGNRRGGAALRAIGRPAEWPTLLVLAKRYRAANTVLHRLAHVATQRGLFGGGFAPASRAGG